MGHQVRGCNEAFSSKIYLCIGDPNLARTTECHFAHNLDKQQHMLSRTCESEKSQKINTLGTLIIFDNGARNTLRSTPTLSHKYGEQKNHDKKVFKFWRQKGFFWYFQYKMAVWILKTIKNAHSCTQKVVLHYEKICKYSSFVSLNCHHQKWKWVIAFYTASQLPQAYMKS